MKNLNEIKKEIQKYQYMEDTSIIDVSVASILANRLKLGDPVWMLIIGASSGGKSQILRPLSITDEKFMFRIDDMTENTLLSATKVKAGSEPVSLLHKIGNHGMVVISDFTVIMSKGAETRASILSQFRMLYDGEMTKHSGNNPEPIKWSGYLGIMAGSTPSVYKHFEEVADMGERFIYYRMKEFDQKKATELALSRTIFGKELDENLADLYKEYIKGVITKVKKEDIEVDEKMKARIVEVAMFAERVRTNASKDWQGNINKIPVPAFPMRVALQLTAIAKGLKAMRMYEGTNEFEESDYSVIDWVGYSLANEENRACLKIIASIDFEKELTTTTIADKIGLETSITRGILQNMSAVGVLKRNGNEGGLTWQFAHKESYDIVRRIEHITEVIEIENRQAGAEDGDEINQGMNDPSFESAYAEFVA